ncbi:hypothetical protein C8E05_3808 [Rhodococcus wratislaviensis]|uniref:Uncharacterized protein n=1 Tax=Rhodococcus wratislaviensis TaxID=44752 RepID=A0AB38FKF0_RHOWR|nr:hypothetical protein [Rhodococcus wratislaviensis]REE74373.1 hypothetical protein C8E05_3808 [Rhodococcus wratislaviensis]SPZ42090.1 Uncharacterised protein [Rhodococcus wratislaviensis]
MATEQFDVTFDGPALDEHRMDVRELAPALLALADAFQTAQTVVAPDARRANLEITASREGSFAVDLVLNSNLIDQALNLLGGRHVTAAANGGGLLGLVLLAVNGIKWLRNRTYTSQDIGDGTVRITTADGDSITLPAESISLVQSNDFRQATQRFTAPLNSEGITSVSIGGPNFPPLMIDQSDLPAFNPSAGDLTVVSDNTIEQVVTVDSVPFRETLQWRLNDGSTNFTATMQDAAFRDRIRRRDVQFGEGDKLRAEIRTIQTMDTNGTLTTQRTIERVIEHLPGPVQGSLFDH